MTPDLSYDYSINRREREKEGRRYYSSKWDGKKKRKSIPTVQDLDPPGKADIALSGLV